MPALALTDCVRPAQAATPSSSPATPAPGSPSAQSPRAWASLPPSWPATPASGSAWPDALPLSSRRPREVPLLPMVRPSHILSSLLQYANEMVCSLELVEGYAVALGATTISTSLRVFPCSRSLCSCIRIPPPLLRTSAILSIDLLFVRTRTVSWRETQPQI